MRKAERQPWTEDGAQWCVAILDRGVWFAISRDHRYASEAEAAKAAVDQQYCWMGKLVAKRVSELGGGR